MSTIPVGKRLRSNQSPQWGFEAKRTVLQGKMEGPRPDKFAFAQSWSIWWMGVDL